jgi:hypothetical protein
MNQLDLAIYNTVHDFSEGTQALADLMGVSRQILLNKANPNTENAYFSPAQLIQIQKLTGNFSINEALTAMEGKKKPTEASFTRLLLQITDELGVAAHMVNEALDDHILTEREKADCLKQVGKVSDACDDLKQALHTQDSSRKISVV